MKSYPVRFTVSAIFLSVTALPAAFAQGQDAQGRGRSDSTPSSEQRSSPFQAFSIGAFRLNLPGNWTRTDADGRDPQVFTKDADTAEKKAESVYLFSFQVPEGNYTCTFVVSDTPLETDGLAKLRATFAKDAISVTNADYEGFVILGSAKGQRTAGATAEYKASKGNCIQVIVKAPLNTKDAALTDFVRSVLGRITCAKP